MKRYLFVLLVALSLTCVIQAGKSRTAPAAINPSCSPCSTSDNITFSGSGFKQGVVVYLEVDGPISHTITVTIDNSGSFFTDFGGLTTYSSGPYTVYAYAISGKRTALVTSTLFHVN